MYSLFWRSPALPYTQKQIAISVPAGSVVSNAASLRFTGKGATNYGKIQQENLLRLLENFAGPTAPDFPTVGQTWYDTLEGMLKVCISTSPQPIVWNQLNSTQITGPGEPPPSPANLGDSWFSQTGSSSGILYVYTGIGRYPQVDWDAVASGYWSPDSITTGVILNASTFGPANTNYGEVYIHGFTAGVPANVQGSIVINGTPTPLPVGTVSTNAPVVDGMIVWDQTGTLVGAPYVCARQFSDGRWFYDNNTTMVEFTPLPNMYAIGRMTVASRDDGLPPGVVSAKIMSTARFVYNLMQVEAVKTGAACGGWEQVWPAVETYGGRREYDYMYSQLASLIGDPLCYGGSGAEGRSIQYLTDFKILDASYQRAWAGRLPQDPNVGTTAVPTNTLRVDPNSNDWDLLLSACRYAVNRLELPAGFLNDLSPFPFVQDGRIIPPFLHSLGSLDVRRPPLERFMKERVGAITVMSSYQETLNVLRAAVNSRYTARGLLEGSGVGNTFTSTFVTTNYANLNANAGAFSGTVIHGMQFVFPTSEANLERFFQSTGGLQVVMTHTPIGGGVGNDLSLKAITDNFGRVRVTADNTYVMTPSPTPTVSLAPSNLGVRNMTAGGIVLATMTSGTSTIVVRGIRLDTFRVQINIEITAGGATSGNFNVLWSFLRDTETYANPGPVLVYPSPLTWQPLYVSGSTLFV